MNINDAFPSRFLKADDLQSREITVIVDRVIMEEVGQGENKETKPCIYFRGKTKGVILNKTNATNIATAYGPDMDAWTGQPVILFPAWVDMQGKTVQAIRIRPGGAVQKAPPPPPVDEMDSGVPF
jgi:hypothetical protein